MRRRSYNVTVDKKQRAFKIIELLNQEHPNPKTELNHKNEMQLSISVAMSSQTTDKKVNEIGAKLFKKYKTWEDFANADLEELQADIRGVNFHKGKAERLIRMAQMVINDFGGKLPRSMENLMKLPGIARKSANVIMNELWDIAEGVVVDTHVIRVSNRLGLTSNKDAVKIEKDLMELFPKETWRNISGALVLHGRYVCKARKPNCPECVLSEICPSAFSFD